jgi:hypothetical protein
LKNCFTRHAITPVPIQGYDGIEDQTTNEIVVTTMDIGGHRTKKACFYVIRNIQYNLILGIKWMRKERVIFNPANEILTFPDRIEINNKNMEDLRQQKSAYEISANALAVMKR